MTNWPGFLLVIVGISLSGVMLPGPLTVATIAKSYRNKNAGAFIALGHAIVELPLIGAIYFGFAHWFVLPEVKGVLSVVGGLVLVYLGSRLFVTTRKTLSEAADLPYNPLIAGVVMTGTNPFFLFWWATIGAALVANATALGMSLLLFSLIHWSCDLVWLQFLSLSVYKSRHLWTEKVQKIIFSICALALVGFGGWFCLSAFM